MKHTLLALSVAVCTALPATAHAAAIPPPPPIPAVKAPPAPVPGIAAIPKPKPPVPPTSVLPPPKPILPAADQEEPDALEILIADVIRELSKAVKAKIAEKLTELKDKLVLVP
ncbi:hypothetical protein GCM10009555_009930 [Acrocarpospora macrocephala]|uniref:Uncharacterized protein n=1 Tax=Acrocarpospora macrocephala TaxID=150177 RepID=A0A5M3WPQ0_9ACTN|nr:hypothetical protein [Acrocarpospora macrocephala]GES10526.1 hypothetical protein Amac_041230 [Acrocarpospora macrocephala]